MATTKGRLGAWFSPSQVGLGRGYHEGHDRVQLSQKGQIGAWFSWVGRGYHGGGGARIVALPAGGGAALGWGWGLLSGH